MDNEECIPCKMASHQMESRIIYEDDNSFAVLDIRPRFAMGQCVVFPKKHVVRVYDLEDEDALHFFQAVKVVARKIEKQFNPEMVAIFVRGRTFPHAHAILFPTFPEDEDMLTQFLRPMFRYSVLNLISDKELDELAAQLRAL